MNNGILKKTEAGWFVLYQVMRDEITSGYDSIPLHPDSQTWMEGYNLYEGREVEFEVRVYPSGTRYAKTIQGQVVLDDETVSMTAEQWVNNQFQKQMINEDVYASKEGIIESHRQFALLEKQQERSYSEEDMQEYAEFCIRCYEKRLPCIIAKDWFEQFKKK